MRKLAFLTLFGLVACSQDPAPPAAETPTPDIPLQMANPDADMEAIAEKALGSVNPLENDLRGLEVAVRLRDAFRISTSGVDFDLKVTDGQGNVPIDESFSLVETNGIDSPTLDSAARDGFYVRTYKLSERDGILMGAADEILQRLKSQSTGDNELTFQAVAHSCVEPDAAEPNEYSLTMYVRSHPDVDFVTLSEEWIVERGTSGIPSAIFEICAE